MNLDERVAKLEQILNEFIERLNHDLWIGQAVKVIQKDILDIKDEIKATKAGLTQLDTENYHAHSAFSETTTALNRGLHEAHKNMSDLSDRHQKLMDSVKYTDSSVNVLNKNVFQLQNDGKILAKHADLDDMRKEQANLIRKFAELNQNCHESTLDHRGKIQSLKDNVSLHASSLDIFRANIHEIIKSQENQNSKISQSILNNQAHVNGNIQDMFTFVNQRINAIPQPKDFAPEFEQMKKDLHTQITPALLDASNALLKVGNFEQQARIFEKKIENIYLILKKLEMAKNE